MAKRTEVRISGFGGQGIVLAGVILARAGAIYNGTEATQTNSHGAESRGGACVSDVVLSRLLPVLGDGSGWSMSKALGFVLVTAVALHFGLRRALADERAAFAALHASDERKGAFIAMLSHELRNPLAPILNGVAILNRVGDDGAQARRARDVIERQARHMARLVDDLLDLTRISRGKLQLRFGAVELGGLVRRAVEDHRALLNGRGIAVALDVRDEPLWLTGDATRLAQVVGNLLSNAAKFADPGGHVWISVARAGGEAVVRVRDDGVGIPPELQPLLFQAFSQAERTLERTRSPARSAFAGPPSPGRRTGAALRPPPARALAADDRARGRRREGRRPRIAWPFPLATSGRRLHRGSGDSSRRSGER